MNILSNDFLNKLIIAPFNTRVDDILGLYIAMLKNISLKIDNTTVKLLYQQSRLDYPIYSCAIEYFSHDDVFVKLGVKSVILNLLKLKNQDVCSYIVTNRSFFAFSVSQTMRKIRTLLGEYSKMPPDENEERIHLILEDLKYFGEFFHLENPLLDDFLSNSIMDVMIMPILNNFMTKDSFSKVFYH